MKEEDPNAGVHGESVSQEKFINMEKRGLLQNKTSTKRSQMGRQNDETTIQQLTNETK